MIDVYYLHYTLLIRRKKCRYPESAVKDHAREDILTENVIDGIFNIKTRGIENPVTGKPLVVYS